MDGHTVKGVWCRHVHQLPASTSLVSYAHLVPRNQIGFSFIPAIPANSKIRDRDELSHGVTRPDPGHNAWCTPI